MKMNVDDKTYELIINEAGKFGKTPEKYLYSLMREITEIKPTREEKKEWKQRLYNACRFLAMERPDFEPRKRDSLEELLESFLYWADEFNEGYFSERDSADTDRYCAWLVQEYEREYGEYAA